MLDIIRVHYSKHSLRGLKHPAATTNIMLRRAGPGPTLSMLLGCFRSVSKQIISHSRDGGETETQLFNCCGPRGLIISCKVLRSFASHKRHNDHEHVQPERKSFSRKLYLWILTKMTIISMSGRCSSHSKAPAILQGSLEIKLKPILQYRV